MKSILIISNNCSGLIQFRKEVFELFIKHGFNLTVAAPKDRMTEILTNIGIQYKNIEFNRKGTNPFADILLTIRYFQLMMSSKPDLVLSYTIKPNLYGGITCRLLSIPQLANITGLGMAAEKKGLLKLIIFSLYRIGLKKAKIVYVQNKHDKEYCIKNKWVNGECVLLPGSGVNLDHFCYQEYPKSHNCKFIFIGRIQKRKGIDIYLEAAKVIKRKYPNVEFHVLGSCEESRYINILKVLETEGIIKYHGHVSDIRPILKETHCTIHPSFYNEGMSNVLLESCSSGRPVITTKKAGCMDVVEQGKNGFIIEETNVENLISQIDFFINLPYSKKEEMGKYSRAKMEKEFDRQIVANEYLNKLHELLSN